jgi:pyruvate dehydrogenase E2 component (dihydrolipoamide acetyltransferase)
MRLMIAERLQKSLHESAQITFHTELDATHLLDARSQCRARGEPIGFEDLVILELCSTLKRHPNLNATTSDRTAHISPAVHVSVAIAIRQGLVAPTIFDADKKSLAEISAQRSDLIERAKQNKLAVKEMSGGTITISNLGQTRVRFFTPILNPPQVAILGVGQIAQRPWVDQENSLCVRPILGLSLTVDHRFIDGEPAGAFLGDLVNALEGCGKQAHQAERSL